MFYLGHNQSKGGTQNLLEFYVDISVIYKSLVTISGQRALLGHRGWGQWSFIRDPASGKWLEGDNLVC